MASGLPDYVTAAQPVPKDARIPWYSGVAPTYAGVMVWFAFWQKRSRLRRLASRNALRWRWCGSAWCCTGRADYPFPVLCCSGTPRNEDRTSTLRCRNIHVRSPRRTSFCQGLFMGVLQFFWLGFNAFFVSDILCRCFEIGLSESV